MTLGIAVRRQDVDIYAIGDRMEVSTAYNLAQDRDDLELVLDVGDRTFWIKVVKAEQLPWGYKHNWLVDIECDEMEALREALTYQVSDKVLFQRSGPQSWDDRDE